MYALQHPLFMKTYAKIYNRNINFSRLILIRNTRFELPNTDNVRKPAEANFFYVVINLTIN